MARALAFIGEHLDEELSVAEVARAASCSPFHFHRQFSAYTGETLATFVTKLRLKAAAYKLAFTEGQSVLDTALESGYAGPESFARAFRRHLLQSPTAFRDGPDWIRLHDHVAQSMNTRTQNMQVEIVEFEECRVAAYEHAGPPAQLMESVGRFIAWRKSCSDSPEASSKTLGIVYSDPDETPPEEFRFDICGSLRGALADNEHGVVEKVIVGGRCARVRHLGSTDRIGETVWALYRDWLPGSGEELRDEPLFFHYIERMPKVTEHNQVTDVYLPLQ